eukprot:g18508.t1
MFYETAHNLVPNPTKTTYTIFHKHEQKVQLDLTIDGKRLQQERKVNSTLILIDLDSNRIGPAAAQHIAKALEVNSTLTALDIGSNGIGPQGAQSIADAIKAK